MWGIVIGAAILIALFIVMLMLALCRSAAEADRQACQELKELLIRRNIREGNSVE